MNEMDDIEKLFSDAFGDGEMTPPESVKKAIDKKLFPARSVSRKWYLISLSLVLLTSSTLIYFNYTEKKNTDSNIKQGQPVSIKDSENQDSDHKKYSQMNYNDSKVEDSENVTSDSDIKKKGQTKFTKQSTYSTEKSGRMEPTKVIGKQNSINGKPNDYKSDNHFKNVVKINDSDFSNDEITPQPELVNASGSKVNSEVEILTKNEISIDKIETIAIAKLSLAAHEITAVKYSTNPAKAKSSLPFSLSLYGGPALGINSISLNKQTFAAERLSVLEKNSFSVSFEVQYKLNNKFGLASGIEYAVRKDEYILEYDKAVLSYIGDSTSIVMDSNGMQTDTIYYAIYGYVSEATSESKTYNYSGFSLPLYFSFNKVLGNSNWSFHTMAGFKLSYVNYMTISTNENIPEVKVNHFGLAMGLRPEIRYTINHLSFGAYLRLGYDIRSGFILDNTERRRMDYSTGISITYHL